MVEVVVPVLHANVLVPVPAAGVAVSAAGIVLAHTSGLLTDTVGFGFTVNVPEPEPVHPFVSVTVTEYVPARKGVVDGKSVAVGDGRVIVNVPPAGIAVRVAGRVLGHTSGIIT